MKKFLSIIILCCAALTMASAQEAEADGDVTFEMADGTTKRGWNRTTFENKVKFIEISDTPRGKRTRYDNDQVARITFDQGAVYVKRDIIATAKGKKPMPGYWVRLDYAGNGITLYSAYIENWEPVNNRRRKVAKRNFYISLGDDNPVWAATDFLYGGVVNRSSFNRTMLNYYFTKRHSYPELGKRIKAKEFDTKKSPLEVVKAWEESYANK